MDMEEQSKKITESDNIADIIVTSPQADNSSSGYQPNWTWGKQNNHYSFSPPPQQPSNLFHKSGWERFWEFIGIGIFATLCNFLIRSCQ